MTSEQAPEFESLLALVGRIRDYVNRPRIHSGLFADRARFNPVCSAMDMIEDTTQGLRAYSQISGEKSDTGSSYLVCFGALQLIYVQQDAVFWLCKSLGYPREVSEYERPDNWIHSAGNTELSEIRNLRNSSIGHPVRRDRGPKSERGSYFIVQMSLSAGGFRLQAIDDSGGATRWISVQIPRLIERQVQSVEAILRRTLHEIAEAERTHREEFRGKSLADAFVGLHYPMEKMGQAVREGEFRQVGMYGVDSVRRAMQLFRGKLEERKEPFGVDLELIYSRLDHALTRLADFFQHKTDDSDLADLLTECVADRIKELREWCRAKDEDYTVAD